MKAIGLIVEYNPFHKGHEIHIANARKLNSSAVLVAVMSPNFIQRGEPAIESKEKRTLDALKNGIDLVVELPTLYCLENADIFASTALKILNLLDVKDFIFGTESGDTEEFLSLFKKKDFFSPRMDELIEEYMDQGLSYPASKAKALYDISSFYLENPNDILGYSYLKAIEQFSLDITPHCYKRINNEKGETKFSNTSAFQIREELKKNSKNRYKFNFLDNYFSLLKYKLNTSTSEELSNIHLIEEGIENLFKKNINLCTNMDEFIKKCTSKRYSTARIKRSVIHILMNNTKEHVQNILSSELNSVRILGYSTKGQEYLKSLRKKENLNLIMRFSAQDYPILLDELKATSLYFINKKEPQRTNFICKEKTSFPIKFLKK